MAMLATTAPEGALGAPSPSVPITGRQLAIPKGPIFHLQRADEADHVIGVFRKWAGYKNFGSDEATDGLVHFQHVLTFASTEETGRTGIHAHFAHAHIVIPVSGRGVFSYDGVITEATPGTMIVQHGGTIHDQFQYSYVPASEADNCKTPLSIEPTPGAKASFSFLELFVPMTFANVEVVPPDEVTADDQRTAWAHPYHSELEEFAVQTAEDPDAAYRPVAGREDIEARDCGTWGATGGLVAAWFIRHARASAPGGEPVSFAIPGESGGLDIFHVMAGSVAVRTPAGEPLALSAGDTLTASQGLAGEPFDASPDLSLIRFFISARTETLRERTPEEIQALEALGAAIITHREVRPEGDTRPVNFLRG